MIWNKKHGLSQLRHTRLGCFHFSQLPSKQLYLAFQSYMKWSKWWKWNEWSKRKWWEGLTSWTTFVSFPYHHADHVFQLSNLGETRLIGAASSSCMLCIFWFCFHLLFLACLFCKYKNFGSKLRACSAFRVTCRTFLLSPPLLFGNNPLY